jgi:hypothetical protein
LPPAKVGALFLIFVMSNPAVKAFVKSTGKMIQVYRLNSGGYNRFLGENISVTSLDAKEHLQKFTDEELEIIQNS